MELTMIKERPIIFSGEMVRAYLEGHKTQTRRVVSKILGVREFIFDDDNKIIDTQSMLNRLDKNGGIVSHFVKSCPYGIPGDHLYVKETYAESPTPKGFIYKADFDLYGEIGSMVVNLDNGQLLPLVWKSSRFMPKRASRIKLKILKIRVEKLQDISKEDCMAEGIKGLLDIHAGWHQSYAELWDKLNAKSGFGWDTNPWVWVIEFPRYQHET